MSREWSHCEGDAAPPVAMTTAVAPRDNWFLSFQLPMLLERSEGPHNEGNTRSCRANTRMITLNLANELYSASPLLDTVPKPRMWAWAKPTRSPQRRRTSEFMTQSLQYYAIWNHPNKPDSYSRLFVFHYRSKTEIRLQTWTDIKTSILS